LIGRIQTRIFLLAVIGGLWTLALGPLLPGVDTLDYPELYQATFTVLISTIVLGIGWELIYQLLQQFRWEKDWPTLFGLITVLNEGAILWWLLSLGVVPGLPDGVPLPTFLILFVSTWLWVWLTANGPMRVPFVRWRFRGGRLI
jgi:hypothetical protein